MDKKEQKPENKKKWEKPKQVGPSPMSTVIKFVKPYKFLTAMLVGFTLIATVLALTIPKYIGYILDAAVKRQNYDNLVVTMAILIGVSLLIGVVQMIAGVYLSQKVAFDLRVAISTKVSKQTLNNCQLHRFMK